MHYRLDALNFFLADVRGGLGAFVSVFLLTEAQWTAAEIGAVLTVSGLIGITSHAPLGALIDATHAKRFLLVGGVALLALCAIAIERAPTAPVVLIADIAMAVLGGIFAPTVAALTLGLVPQREFAARLARNAVFDRVGNVFITALVGLIGWWLTQRATFYLVPLFAVLSAWAVLSIPAAAIDHERARGFIQQQPVHEPESWWRLFSHHRMLLLLAVTIAVFHFANASMLPLAGQKLALAHPGLETALLAACILIAQFVTMPVAVLTGLKVDAWGRKPLLVAACLALAARGAVFAWFDSAPILIAAQILDGVSAGILDVLLPLMLGDIMGGTGRYSLSRGVVGTVQGVGGSLSNVAAGTLVVWGGYGVTFAALALAAGLAAGLAALAIKETGRGENRPIVGEGRR
jgi:MFS family permease